MAQDETSTENHVPHKKRGFTYHWRELHNEVDNDEHPHYDEVAFSDTIGNMYDCHLILKNMICKRRTNAHFGYLRSWSWCPVSEITESGRTQRDHLF